MEPATDGALAGRERGGRGRTATEGSTEMTGRTSGTETDLGEKKKHKGRKEKNGKAFGVGGLKPGGSKKGETNKKKGGT